MMTTAFPSFSGWLMASREVTVFSRPGMGGVAGVVPVARITASGDCFFTQLTQGSWFSSTFTPSRSSSRRYQAFSRAISFLKSWAPASTMWPPRWSPFSNSVTA